MALETDSLSNCLVGKKRNLLKLGRVKRICWKDSGTLSEAKGRKQSRASQRVDIARQFLCHLSDHVQSLRVIFFT